MSFPASHHFVAAMPRWVRCPEVSLLFSGPGLAPELADSVVLSHLVWVLPRALRMLLAPRRAIEKYSSEAPEDFLIPLGTVVPGFLEMPQRSAPAVVTASGLLACQPSLPERVASWRGCPRVQSPRAILPRGSSILSPRSTGTTATGPATCQLGLPQPDRHPQPGYKSGVPWDPAPSSPKEALSWEGGAGHFLATGLVGTQGVLLLSFFWPRFPHHQDERVCSQP